MIVAAAVRANGKIYTDKRHVGAMEKAVQDGVEYISQDMQGFVDGDGKFYSSSEAANHVFECKQLKELRTTVYSEDLR